MPTRLRCDAGTAQPMNVPCKVQRQRQICEPGTAHGIRAARSAPRLSKPVEPAHSVAPKRLPADAGKRLFKAKSIQGADDRRQHKPQLQSLVVVEGYNDKLAVVRAVHAEVFVLGGAMHAKDARAVQQLQAKAARHPDVILLLDPDPAGRQGRALLEAALGPACRHAFVPGAAATATAVTRQHLAGNLGVEHCAPAAIQQALLSALPADPKRQEFSRDDLIGLQLVTPMGTASQGTNNAPMRRELVGVFLGFGKCDGKQLLVQLNKYGTSRQALWQAVQHANSVLTSAIQCN